MAEEIIFTVNDTQETVSLFVDEGSVGITSFNGRNTPAAVPALGDYTTAQVTEDTNLYYTDDRVEANGVVVSNTSKITTSRFEARCLGQAVNGRIDNYTSALANIALKESTASLLFDAKICGVGDEKLFNLLPFDIYKDFTVARNGTATYIGSDGFIKTALANVPRIDYTDSVNPALLVEPQATNLLTYSEDFTQWETLNGGLGSLPIVTSNNIISPEGIQNADKIIFDKGMASGNADFSLIRLNYGGVDIDGIASVYIKSDTPVDVEISTNDTTYKTVSITTEWKIVTVSGSASDRLSIGLRGSIPINTDATVYVWGAQLETGTVASSYIPTEGTTVTRVADVVTGAGSVNDLNSEEGVLFIEMAALSDVVSSNKIISISDGTNDNQLLIRYQASQIISIMSSAGVNQTTIAINVDIENFNKVAVQWKLNEGKVFVNGTQADTTDTSFNVPVADSFDRLDLARSTGSDKFEGKIRQLKVYKTALTDLELATLTAL